MEHPFRTLLYDLFLAPVVSLVYRVLVGTGEYE